MEKLRGHRERERERDFLHPKLLEYWKLLIFLTILNRKYWF